MKKIFHGLIFSVVALFSFTTSAAESLLINGAGATFPYPLYSKWFYEYQKINPAVKINYQSIGSGGGIKQVTEKTIDFGASDAPMSDAELSKLSAPIVHIPTVLGAVAVAYHLPHVGSGLKLTGPVLASIFLGQITKWNDVNIAKLNPGKTLPSQDILVAHRTDGSGTTYVFTEYLSKISSPWKTKVGAGKSVQWPAGLGGKGNEGVTALIKQTPGAIGYIELGFAMQNQLPVAAIQNKAGNFIAPAIASVSAAASGVKLSADYRVSLTDSTGAEAYPISSFTYLLVYKKQVDPVKGKALVDFLKWAIHDGQKMAEPLYYAPLPGSVVSKVDQTIGQVQ
ncbi:MAG: phosphate ABC transporter substrate-binding protein PstS [Deltaproteobacteria bacterium]|nr:phosphate ABC transporter substrate-binding protein PstS [Deltaproteobacteria bacterium]